MIQRLAEQATSVLISGNVAKVEESDIFGLVKEGATFMACFALLRHFAGGIMKTSPGVHNHIYSYS